MMPKVGSPRDVVFVDTLLSQIEANRPRHEAHRDRGADRDSGGLPVRAGDRRASSPRLEALIFGAGDYAASMRMPSAGDRRARRPRRRLSRPPLARRHAHDRRGGARQRPAVHGRSLRRLHGHARDSSGPAGSRGRLGFDGKQCIHPAQLPTVNARRSLPPTPKSRRRPRSCAAYDAAVGGGQGAATHDGRMIDAANVRMARTTLERQRLISTT